MTALVRCQAQRARRSSLQLSYGAASFRVARHPPDALGARIVRSIDADYSLMWTLSEWPTRPEPASAIVQHTVCNPLVARNRSKGR